MNDCCSLYPHPFDSPLPKLGEGLGVRVGSDTKMKKMSFGKIFVHLLMYKKSKCHFKATLKNVVLSSNGNEHVCHFEGAKRLRNLLFDSPARFLTSFEMTSVVAFEMTNVVTIHAKEHNGN